MFYRFQKVQGKWESQPGNILINTDHIVSVEEDAEGRAIITVTGKDKDDSILFYKLTNSFADVASLLNKVGR